MRFRGLSGPAALAHVARVREEITRATGGLWVAGAPIDEWVVFDTLTAMDRGWVNPAANLVVALVGPTASGKTAVEGILADLAADKGIDLRVVRMADGTKAKFCQARGLAPDHFEDRARKEASRADLAAFGEALLREDPEAFFGPARTARALPGHVGMVLVPDLRMVEQHKALAQGGPLCVLRLVASTETRLARGYVPSGADASVFESEMDLIPADHVICNEGTLADLQAAVHKALFGDIDALLDA